jgi:hypothetical protein
MEAVGYAAGAADCAAAPWEARGAAMTHVRAATRPAVFRKVEIMCPAYDEERIHGVGP